jgi:hypothetical protein
VAWYRPGLVCGGAVRSSARCVLASCTAGGPAVRLDRLACSCHCFRCQRDFDRPAPVRHLGGM